MTAVFITHPADKLEQYFGVKAIAALKAIADVRFNPYERELNMVELIDAAQGCDALIAYRATPGPEQLFSSLPGLFAFVRNAIDIRTVDLDAANVHGVLVTQTSAGFVPAVAEWVVAAMVNLGRDFCRYAEVYHAGEVPRPVMGRQLHGATLGLVGYGQIARLVSEYALAFGMRTLVTTPEEVDRPGVKQVPLSTLLAESDFLVCLATANAQTAHMFDAATFSAMKTGAFFINASRGELVDESALHKALESGRLAGCAVDVGMAADQMPTLFLARHPRLIATPHVGGLTQETIDHQALVNVSQIAALQQGHMPAGAVNPAHATRWRRACATAQFNPHSTEMLP